MRTQTINKNNGNLLIADVGLNNHSPASHTEALPAGSLPHIASQPQLLRIPHLDSLPIVHSFIKPPQHSSWRVLSE